MTRIWSRKRVSSRRSDTTKPSVPLKCGQKQASPGSLTVLSLVNAVRPSRVSSNRWWLHPGIRRQARPARASHETASADGHPQRRQQAFSHPCLVRLAARHRPWFPRSSLDRRRAKRCQMRIALADLVERSISRVGRPYSVESRNQFICYSTRMATHPRFDHRGLFWKCIAR